MGAMTSDELARFFREAPFNALKLEGITETEDSRYLGAIGLLKDMPIFRCIFGFAFNGELSDSARFHLWPLKREVEGIDGVAAVFRQFEHSKYQAAPEDLLAGWVPPEDADKLRTWIEEMNVQLAALLRLKALFQANDRFFRTTRDDEVIRKIVNATPIGFVTHVVDGARARDKGAFMDEVARALSFPDYFGKNWDAFDECLDDLAQDGQKHLVVFLHADELLKESPADLKILVDVLAQSPLKMLFQGTFDKMPLRDLE